MQTPDETSGKVPLCPDEAKKTIESLFSELQMRAMRETEQLEAKLAVECRQLAQACYAQALMAHFRSAAYNDFSTGIVRNMEGSREEALLFAELCTCYQQLLASAPSTQLDEPI